MRDLVAGIDSSTQSCTVVLRHVETGATVAEARAPHPPTVPPKSEQSPEAWWRALCDALAQLSEHLPRIAALSVGAQGHGLVMLGADGQPLRDAKLWNDTESAADARTLRTQLADADWARRTGSVPGPALTISKLAWTRRVLPELLPRARHILLPSDYLIWRLTGRAITERGIASGTGYFDPARNAWDLDLLALVDPARDWLPLLPEIIDSAAPAGTVMRLPGLEPLEGAVVGAGSGDNMTAALGLGIVPGDTVISLGTSGTLYGISPHPIHDAQGFINGYADATGAFLPMITTLNSAKVTDAFRRLLNLDFEAFDRSVLNTPLGAGGVTLVAYLDGERTPNRPGATGTLSGLRSDVTPGQVARAAVEGVLCGLLEGGDILSAHGLPQGGRLTVTGGGARSRAYRQVLADLSGRPVHVCDLPEAAAAGAAVQALAALTGKATADCAADWAPRHEMVAEPGTGSAEAARILRQSYREACLRAGGKEGP